MPTKMATCCREKGVLVAVYVERPSKRKPAAPPNVHHHHHHHHLHLHKHGGDRGDRRRGYNTNRKAELLNYSHRLRDSARSQPSSPHLHDHNHHPNPIPPSHNQQPIITQIMRVKSNPKNARGPACLGSWKISIPNFLRSFIKMSQSKKEKKKKSKKVNSESTSSKAKAIMKSFQGKKEKGFVSKVFAAIQKHR